MNFDYPPILNVTALLALVSLIINIKITRQDREREARALLFDDQVGKTVSRRLGNLNDLHSEIISLIFNCDEQKKDGFTITDRIERIYSGRVQVCLRSLTSTLNVIHKNHAKYFPDEKDAFKTKLVGDELLQQLRELIEQTLAELHFLIDEIKTYEIPTTKQITLLNQQFLHLDEVVRVHIAEYRNRIYLYVPNPWWRF